MTKLTNILTAIAVGYMFVPSVAFSDEVPTIIFTENGVYLSANPEAFAKIGERLSLMDLGRRFPSCRVVSEYFSNDFLETEQIITTIKCRPGGAFPIAGESDARDVSVSVNMDDTGKIYGFSTTTRGAAFTDNVQVGDPVIKAVGHTAYCNLCTEDEPIYCMQYKRSVARYYVGYPDDCVPLNIENPESCRGVRQIEACALITNLWTSAPGVGE